TTTTAPAAAQGGFGIVQAPYGTRFLDLTGRGQSPLSDIRVRQALNYAIDRKAITKAVLGQYGEPSSQVITGNPAAGYSDKYPYDPAKAKALLRQAGYGNGFTLKALSLAADQVFDRMMSTSAEYLQKVGVKLDIDTAPTVAGYFQKQASAKYPIQGN